MSNLNDELVQEVHVINPGRVGYTVGYKRNMGQGSFETLHMEFYAEENLLEGETIEQGHARLASTLDEELLTNLEELSTEIGERAGLAQTRKRK